VVRWSGGLDTRSFGWLAIFWINAPLGAAMVVAVRRTVEHGGALRSSARSARERIDVAGLVLSAVGLSALVFGLTQASVYGWTSVRLWVILAVAAAALAGFVMVERRVAAPLLDLRLFRRPNVLAGTCSRW